MFILVWFGFCCFILFYFILLLECCHIFKYNVTEYTKGMDVEG